MLARSNVVMGGYWNQPDATADAIHADGSSGPTTSTPATVASSTTSNYVTISDRKKDVIISGGENVSSIEVEDAVFSHPDVNEVAVIGVPDERWGELVMALVVKADGSALTEDELIAYTKTKLAGYKCPKRIEFRDALARTATGKLQKFKLREPYWAGKHADGELTWRLRRLRGADRPGGSTGIATVTIDNGPINLFDRVLYPEMARLAGELAADDDVRVVVLCSANPSWFIAHFDVALILRWRSAGARPAPTMISDFHLMCERLRTMPKATIAVIEGRVGGGGSELALSCDMRFAAVGRAVFNQPEVALGIIPGGSGTVRLPRLVGRGSGARGHPRLRRHRRRHRRVVGLGQPGPAARPSCGRSCATWPRRIAGFPPMAVAEAKASVLRARPT